MRKLKKFNLDTTHLLSADALISIEGGVFYLTECTMDTIGSPCVTPLANGFGVVSGICGYGTASSGNPYGDATITYPICIPD